MKYCPKCMQEFDDPRVDTCPACDEPLAASRNEALRTGKTAVFTGRTRADAEFALEVLKTHDLPAKIDLDEIFEKGPGVAFVPDAHAEKARAAVEDLDAGGDEGGNVILPPRCPTCKDKLVSVQVFETVAAAEEMKSFLAMNGIPASIENAFSSSALGEMLPLVRPEVKIPASYARDFARLMKNDPTLPMGRLDTVIYGNRIETRYFADLFIIRFFTWPFRMLGRIFRAVHGTPEKNPFSYDPEEKEKHDNHGDRTQQE